MKMKNRVVFILLFLLFSHVQLSSQESEMEKNKRRLLFIEDFIATYEASYEKKKIDYIENFFSNNALVITETKELRPVGNALSPCVNKDRPYKSLIEDKDKYIKRLKEIFNKNINIKLSLANIRNSILNIKKYMEFLSINYGKTKMEEIT